MFLNYRVRAAERICPMLMRQPHLQTRSPYVLPFGATSSQAGGTFRVFSRSATSMRLMLYDRVNDREPADTIEFDRDSDRWGDVWSLSVPGVSHGQLYHLQASGPNKPEIGMRFNGSARLIDPYTKALAGDFLKSDDGIIRPPKCVLVDEEFDWQGDRPINRDIAETVIYEMHVRGFTRSRSSQVKHPGTYLGVIEKIPYLQSLGITSVELLPVHEFPILGIDGYKLPRPNFWGYDPMAFFSPHRGYAVGKEPGSQVREFKEMVKALHGAGIEVILDVVFNHTCEGNENGPTLSFKGLENSVYYILEKGGQSYSNYSGCGNTLNCNHPVTREMIFHCLRHWVTEYHVDGFRFDLASILSRDRNGTLVSNAPVVELIAEDPVLAKTKLIAEAWDAAGAYQVGSFGGVRWSEWNGRYRDDIRRFWRGDGGMLGSLATRLAGSSDLYEHGGRPPQASVNFITSHDGFTMNDLVSYNNKHNEANGESNRDGDNNNHSNNMGVEGPTRRRPLNTIRARQVRNMLATLMLSQGVPMIVSGDECRRSQRGNNNAYCQDNEVSWFDWRLAERYKDLVRFVGALTKFRREQPTIRRKRFLTGNKENGRQIPDVAWFGPNGHPLDWGQGHSAMVAYLGAPPSSVLPETSARDIMIIVNGTGHDRAYTLPDYCKGLQWNLFVDTAEESPKDVFPEMDGPAFPASRRMHLPPHSMRVYVSEPVIG